MGLPGWILHARYFAPTPYAPLSLSSCLRGNLALGLNFPVSLFLALWQPLVYKASRTKAEQGGFIYDESYLHEATLQSIKLDTNTEQGPWSRSQLLRHVKSGSLNTRFHVTYLWAIAASDDGMVKKIALTKYQEGVLLYELSKRRRIRTDVIPFSRGGPIGVGGHSWFVKKIFDVDVYRKPKGNS